LSIRVHLVPACRDSRLIFFLICVHLSPPAVDLRSSVAGFFGFPITRDALGPLR